MNSRVAAGALLLAAAVSGCNSAPKATLVNPATINLDDAVEQVRESLNKASANARADGHYVGLDICTATIALTLTVQGTSDNKGGGTLAVAAPVIPVSIGLNASTEQTLVENRGNVITLNLTTPACNPTGTLGTTHPDKVAQLAKANSLVRQSHWTPLIDRRTTDLQHWNPFKLTPTAPPAEPAPAR